MDDTFSDKELDTKLQQVNNEFIQRCEAEYDGVLGTLPEWIPDSQQQEFHIIRSRLLEYYDHPQILQWIGSYIAHRLVGEIPVIDYRQPVMPPRIRYDISVLALIKNAVLLGKKKGLGQLAGNLAVKGDDFSQGGGTKKGMVYEPRKSVEIICDEIKSFDFNEVLKVLKYDDKNGEVEKLDDLLSLIDVIFGDVDNVEERIYFYKRGVNPCTENKKSISFDRLKNILSELRKEK